MTDNQHQTDLKYIDEALKLACLGDGLVSPNPVVGAVIVKDGKIAGKGYHKKAGEAHAEVLALREAGENARDATLYVSLEPCNHQGRTPPCTEAIIKAGIKRVVFAIKDPNPNVTGNGNETLIANGIETSFGLRKEEAEQLNEKYIYNTTTGLPFVTLKMGVSLDGKIATSSGNSQWITSQDARIFAHHLRKSSDAVAVGSGTLKKDNPRLTVRLEDENSNYVTDRIVFSSTLSFSKESKFFDHTPGTRSLIVTSTGASKEKIKEFEEVGAMVITTDVDEDVPDVIQAVKELFKRGIHSILIEGGGKLAASFIKARMVNKAVFVLAPMLIGGCGTPMIGDLGIDDLREAPKFKNVKWNQLGNEMIFTGYLK